eukprot:CAMPEP_0196661846 /NCGR_PEP_ID=MMETSP1086-20130531/46073_1 /TAXON_ID=77921 /ORGANISM="Cyanoptyche  gloeocystis , Strain SAG4.97" /LENGTH=66 /DNA_ID=CAMNT_0041996933 /DNA_START=266 /DNA_END=463 /DNA_ORIENTATION=-
MARSLPERSWTFGVGVRQLEFNKRRSLILLDYKTHVFDDRIGAVDNWRRVGVPFYWRTVSIGGDTA